MLFVILVWTSPGHRIDGQAPEVHEPADVDEREDDHEEDEERGDQVSDEQGRRHKDGEHGEAKVHVKLPGNHLVCFPTEMNVMLLVWNFMFRLLL